MRGFFVFFLMALIVSACVPHPMGGSHQDIKLRMEVAYSLLGDISGAHRVRAIYRVPSNITTEAVADDEVTATVQCDRDVCAIVRIVKRLSAASKPAGMTISGRIFGTDAQTHGVILVLDPFPVEVPQTLYSQLAQQPGRTKIVSVAYRQLEGALVFHDLRLVGEEARDPVQWK
ncbi:MAG: hypothetical protein JSS45_06245 [Proteobacteria bacterium]|nr:hypothetical protein [Pseudomonadota bacterium]